MFEQVAQAARLLREAAAAFEPRTLEGEAGVRLLEQVVEAERLAAAMRTSLARRVEETRLWRREGHRSAAHYLAAKTGASVGAAVATLQMARRLEDLPATQEALRAGRLSEVAAREIAGAATAASERGLLAAAAGGMAGLRERCQQARAGEDSHQRVRRSRHLRQWTDGEGAYRLDVRTTPEDGAVVRAALAPIHRRLVREARAGGRTDTDEALAADALVELAERAGGGDTAGVGPRAMVHVRVDAEVLETAAVAEGQTCEIVEVGPVPAATARALTHDAVVKAVITKGVEVVGVAHLGRTVTAAQRTALEERDRTCVVEGCAVKDRLEIDHVDGWALTRTTTLDRLARLCRWHHYLKTHCGYVLDGRPGRWRWLPPPDPG